MKFFGSLALNIYYIVFPTWVAVLAGNPLLLVARLVILGYMIWLLVYDMKFFSLQPNNFQDDELRKREEVNFFIFSIENLIN